MFQRRTRVLDRTCYSAAMGASTMCTHSPRTCPVAWAPLTQVSAPGPGCRASQSGGPQPPSSACPALPQVCPAPVAGQAPVHAHLSRRGRRGQLMVGGEARQSPTHPRVPTCIPLTTQNASRGGKREASGPALGFLF